MEEKQVNQLTVGKLRAILNTLSSEDDDKQIVIREFESDRWQGTIWFATSVRMFRDFQFLGFSDEPEKKEWLIITVDPDDIGDVEIDILESY